MDANAVAASSETVVARDLADMSITAGQIAGAVNDVADALGDAHEYGEKVPPSGLALLYQQRGALDALILDVEGVLAEDRREFRALERMAGGAA